MIKGFQIKRLEPLLFFSCTVVACFQFWSLPFFYTLDGPAHIYNAKLIAELWQEPNSPLYQVFNFNPTFVPNWIGHLILIFLNVFYTPEDSNAILLSLCLIGIPFSFRLLVSKISPENQSISWLTIPISQNTLMYLGFFNFQIGITILLLTLSQLYQFYQNPKFSWIKILLFFLLFLLLYLSHLFVLFIALGIGISLPLYQIIIKANINHKIVLKKALAISLVALPFFLLTLSYFLNNSPSLTKTYLSPSTLNSYIENFVILDSYIPEQESIFNYKVKAIFYILFIIVIYQKISSIIKNAKLSFNIDDFWLFLAISFLTLYYILPDSDGKAGYISFRLIIFLLLFFLIWASTRKIENWFKICIGLVIFFVQTDRNNYVFKIQTQLNEFTYEAKIVSSFIPKNSVVLPLNFTSNWLLSHQSNCLALSKNLLILENYECSTGYFPITFSPSIPNYSLGDIPASSIPSCGISSNNNARFSPIDYVFITGNETIVNDPQTIQIKNTLRNNYKLICKTNNCKLFKKIR